MDSNALDVADADRVRLLTLNRPDVLNAFNDALYDSVRAALVDAADNDGIHAVVVTGAGRAFSAGQDLDEMRSPARHDDGERHGFPPFIETIEVFDKPLIAAVNGLGVGIGMTVLPHCDLVYMAKSARLRAPFARLGLLPEAGSSALLPDRLGWQPAAKALFTADFVTADEAVRSGLALAALPEDELVDHTMDVARRIARMPLSSLVGTKRLLLAGRSGRSKDARQRENPAFASLVGSPANREALAAFEQKREPSFGDLEGDRPPEVNGV